jgi:benzoyl-CoA reductase subunit D
MASLQVESHLDSIYAGAIGAALWGAFRHEKLKQLTQPVNEAAAVAA